MILTQRHGGTEQTGAADSTQRSLGPKKAGATDAGIPAGVPARMMHGREGKKACWENKLLQDDSYKSCVIFRRGAL